MRWLRSVGRDIRFGCRLLARQPAFALAAVLVAALGIGAMTSVFCLIDAAMLRRLPYPHADRLVWISAVNRRRGVTGGMVTLGEEEHWQRAAKSVVQAVAFGGEMNSTQVDAGTRRLARATVRGASDNTFPMLGARPLMGRLLGPGDTIEDAVISYRFWQRVFHGAPNVVGQSLDAPGYLTPWTVVGVLPPGFAFGGGRQTDIWVATTTEAQVRDVRYRWAIALLRSGVTARQAEAALNLADRQLAGVDPAERGWSAEVEPLRRHFFGHLNDYFLLLFGAAGLVLLLACGNLAALLLARAAGRQRELAIRAALGAGRARLARQLLAETLVIAAAGGAVGLAVAALALRWMTAEAPASLAAAFGVLRPQALAWPVLGFAAAAMAGTGLLAGLAPARWAARLDLRGAMQGSGTRDRRSYSWFVAGQTALALVLLASALLLLRSFGDLLSAPLGFRSQNLVNVSVILRTRENLHTTAGSAEHWWAAMAPWWGSLLRRVRALPAVAGAGVTSNLPLGPSNRAAGPTSELGLTMVSPGFLPMMGIRLLRGRYFGAQDTADAPRRIILSQSAAERLFPHQDPVGRHVKLYRCLRRPYCEVIGVVADTRQTTLRGTEPIWYESLVQDPVSIARLVVRTNGPPARVVAELRTALARMPPVFGARARFGRFTEMGTDIAAAAAEARFRAWLLATFAAIALALALVGIFGVMKYLVGRRTAEMSVRMALGATPGRVVAGVLAQAARWLAVGIALGLAGAILAGRLLRAFLFGVSGSDPGVLAAAALGLIAAGLAAAYWPARRAGRVDPAQGFRAE